MAVSQTVVWEARGSGASANNGGGFNPSASGVDYSQQNSPQYTITTATSSGSGDTILTATAAADMVGNIGQALSGTNINPGFYEVVSVVVGVSITFTTNAAGQSICSGTAVGGHVNIGGALDDWYTAYLASAIGNIIWAKGTFTRTTTAFLNGILSLILNGYGSTRGDKVKATITTATNSTGLIRTNGTVVAQLSDIALTNTAGTRAQGIFAAGGGGSVTSGVLLYRCSFTGFSIHVDYYGASDTHCFHFTAVDCVFDSSTGIGLYFAPFKSIWKLQGCIVKNSGTDGIKTLTGGFGDDSSALILENTVFYNNAGCGANLVSLGALANSLEVWADGCAFVSNGSDGLNRTTAGGTAGQMVGIFNTIFQSNVGFSINVDPSSGFTVQPAVYYGQNNAFLTSVNSNNFPTLPNQIIYTVDAFVSVGTNFHLNATAGGGADLAQQGFQSSVLG